MGTNSVKDLSDTSLEKGICAIAPGWISIALNKEIIFDEIRIGGYNGNSTGWFVGNGCGAKIQSSMDGNEWKEIGTIPPEFGHIIQKLQVTSSKAKFIKFVHTDMLGIGFLEIKEKKKGK